MILERNYGMKRYSNVLIKQMELLKTARDVNFSKIFFSSYLGS